MSHFNNKINTIVGVVAVFLLRLQCCDGCTNLIVTPGASKDQSMILAYNADGSDYFGMLYHYPANKNTTNNKMRKIYNWMTGEYLGEIPEAKETYNVIGNCNEFGLCIAESSWEGVEILSEQPQKGALIDYGSLMFLTLQRSKSATEAIDTMVTLMDTYGYASVGGETFSIVDAEQAWMMDVIARRSHTTKGSVYVAQRVPDGYIVALANRAKTTTFPRNDPDNCLFSKDVVEMAQSMGLYNGDDEDDSFNFRSAYESEPSQNNHFSQARVLDIYSHLLSSSKDGQEEFFSTYIDSVMGKNNDDDIPIWIQPQKKVSLNDVREQMASHFEGTSLEYGTEIAGGLFYTPYRPKPLVWDYQKKTYFHERTIATEFTGSSFISVIRGWMPYPLQAIVWVGMDDSSTCPRYPVYASSTAGSDNYIGKGSQDGVTTTQIMKFDAKQAFWIQNLVSNFVYSRWSDAYPVLKSKLDEVHDKFEKEIAKVDEEALKVYNNYGDSKEDAKEIIVYMLTTYSVAAGDELHKIWSNFFGYLFTRFRDMIIMEEDESRKNCGCNPNYIGYDDLWKERIIAERGPHYFAKKSEPVHAKDDESFTKETAKPTRNFFSLISHLLLAAAAAPFIFVALQCIRRRLSVSIDDKLPSEADRLTMDNSVTTSYGATNQLQMKNGTNGKNDN